MNEAFLKYLAENQGHGGHGERGECANHRIIKYRVRDNPAVVGISEDITGRFCEVPFFRGHRDLITIVDVVLVTPDDAYFIEVKSTNHGVRAYTNRTPGEVYRFVRERFGISPFMWVVYEEGRKLRKKELKFRLRETLGVIS